MKHLKTISILLVFTLAFSLLAVGCSGEFVIKDGTYRAEYDSFDQHGYKDFIVVTFKDGQVTDITADAVSETDGSLKSESAAYREAMEPISGTYPEKCYKDLINQFLADPANTSAIDIVAGATSTSESFIALVRALEKNIQTGNTDTVIVKR